MAAPLTLLPACIAISLQAALAPEGKPEGTSVLSVSVGATSEDKFVLCHLTPGSCDQWALDVGFAPEDGEVTFHLTGKTAVHLTGFHEMDDDDEDDDDEDMDEEAMKQLEEEEGEEEDDDEEEDEEEDDDEEERT